MQSHDKYHDYEFPLVSILIPTYNNSRAIAFTLDSLLSQAYPQFEVVIIDGGSTDRSLEIVKSYHDERIHIFTTSGFHLYEMLNQGIAKAKGTYITTLLPGDYYISPHTLRIMMNKALDHQQPHLVYCGALLRDGRSDPKILYRPLNIELLRKGQQPTSIQSMWFRAETFREIGTFDPALQMRGGYDLLCRFLLHGKLTVESISRVLTDYDLRFLTRKTVWRHFWETGLCIFRYFGFWAMLRWLWIQKDLARYRKLWIHSVRTAFLGR